MSWCVPLCLAYAVRGHSLPTSFLPYVKHTTTMMYVGPFCNLLFPFVASLFSTFCICRSTYINPNCGVNLVRRQPEVQMMVGSLLTEFEIRGVPAIRVLPLPPNSCDRTPLPVEWSLVPPSELQVQAARAHAIEKTNINILTWNSAVCSSV